MQDGGYAGRTVVITGAGSVTHGEYRDSLVRRHQNVLAAYQRAQS